MDSPATERRWFIPTPSRLVHTSLLATAVLLLSDRWQWFSFNQHKGWTVLIANAVYGVFAKDTGTYSIFFLNDIEIQRKPE